MDAKNGIIYRTTDYSKFKRLDGNRKIPSSRVSKIVNSIKKVGYILSPILVNEKYEVIDGQGRLEALKQLGMPVDYIISCGIGIEECVAMNIYQTNWTMTDYIESYAETGSMSYIYLLQLIRAFGKKLQTKVIISAVTGKDELPQNQIRNGDFVCTVADYNMATSILTYLLEFKPVIDRVG